MSKLLPTNLKKIEREITAIAKGYGLNFFDTIFEMVDFDQINQLAARGGFPIRYPHWKWGMEYDQFSKGQKFGLSKIYEMVINTDPCYAYLQIGNSELIQKIVITHVLGHSDFFKNNVWFSKTNRKMLDQMANHSVKIQKYMDLYGEDQVEGFIDCCLSLENLINKLAPFEPLAPWPKDLTTTNDDSIFKGQKDILLFLMHQAPLSAWQQDVLGIIREEALYMAPQGLTKTLNEGWASFWHSKMLTEKVLKSSEIIDFADLHSGVTNMSVNSYNPYKVGIELLRDIEYRYNTGRVGADYENCQDLNAKLNWDTKAAKGLDKIFEVRKLYNDVSLIEEFLTPEFCLKHKMFIYKMNPRTNKFEPDTNNFQAIKSKLLFLMANFGQPVIKVEHHNYQNKGELLLSHLHEGVDLQPDYLQATLKNLFLIWQNPVSLSTVMQGYPYIWTFDGKEMRKTKSGEEKR